MAEILGIDEQLLKESAALTACVALAPVPDAHVVCVVGESMEQRYFPRRDRLR